MEIGWRDSDFAETISRDMVAAVVYGENHGKVSSSARAITEAVLGDSIDDPFCYFSFDNDALESSPQALLEEAANLSLAGGRKLIRLFNPSGKFAEYVGEFLSNPLGNSFILVVCESLATQSEWRKLFKPAKNGALMPCYIADDRGSRGIIEGVLRERGVKISGDALRVLSESLSGRDDGVIRMEAEKLALYAAESKYLDIDAVHLLCHSGVDPDVEAFILGCLAGQLRFFDAQLEALYTQGVEHIVLVRSLARNALRLLSAKQKMLAGADFDSMTKSIKLFYKLKADFRRALDIWDMSSIYSLLLEAQTAEAQIKSNYGFESLIIGRLLQRNALMARKLSRVS